MSDSYPNWRARLREILDSLYDPDNVDSLRIPDLIDQATQQIDNDQPLRLALLRQAVDTFVREIVQRKIASTRGLILMGDEVVSREAFEARVVQRAKRFERWLEHAGDRHIQLLAMRKNDLLVAAQEREEAGITELQIAALWRYLAARLGPDEQVGDHYTTDDIARLAERLKVTYSVRDDNGPTVIEHHPEPPLEPQSTTTNPPSSPTRVRVRVPAIPRPKRRSA